MPIKGLSLWFMPTGSVYEHFMYIIKTIAEEYNAPLFEPHVTLLGIINESEEKIIEKASKIALQHEPFPIKLQDIIYEDYYYRSLIVQAEKSPELMQIHQETKKIFGIHDANTYMPHLSIMYGNQTIATKEEIIAKIRREQRYEFLAECIYLISSNGDESMWKIIESFPLGGLKHNS